MDAIVYIAQGDMRKAINALQGAAIIRSAIDEKMIYAITSTARPDEISDLLALSLKGDFDGANPCSPTCFMSGVSPRAS